MLKNKKEKGSIHSNIGSNKPLTTNRHKLLRINETAQ